MDIEAVACEKEFVDARGLRFHCLRWGAAEAPPLVLLHGLTGHARIWELGAARLAERFRLYAPDQRGHGETSHADRYRTQDFVDDLAALVSAWGLQRFDLMGLSMGGHNAMAYAAQYPAQVARLVVIDIPPSFDLTRSADWPEIQRTAREGHRRFASFDEAFAEARRSNATAPDENLRHRTRWNLRELPGGGLCWRYDHRVQAYYEPEDLWPRLAGIRCPMLLVRAGLTEYLSRSAAERAVAAAPDATLVEIAESGHSIPTDCPDRLADVVLDWLR